MTSRPCHITQACEFRPLRGSLGRRKGVSWSTGCLDQKRRVAKPLTWVMVEARRSGKRDDLAELPAENGSGCLKI
jgi:hypothetical protein